ncbi:MAG: 4-hydroxy-tetrahydrodipicolinate synthase [Myxococcales bacterium]|nr:4-hydroxy-tetrahydrodipicolinate synthase [Myxococcales bacterium]
MYKGAMTALVTPFRGGEVAVDDLRRLVDFQIEQGIDGLVPCGTTGETATLSLEEQALVMRTVVEQTKGRVPVIAGAGANSTKKAIELSKMAAETGADGLLHVSPYYNKPTQAGLVAHFRAVADATSLPIVLYNVPGRTAGDMLPETVAELSKHERIVAIKEATASIQRAGEVIAAVPEDFSVLSGDDFTCAALILMGGKGVISVISNVMPGETAKLAKAALDGDAPKMREHHYRMQKLMHLLFTCANPIPVKAAMAMMGFGENALRLPLLPLDAAAQAPLKAELSALGLI